MSTTLPLFWDLSSADKKKRLVASVKLISALEKFQISFKHKSVESGASSNEDDSSGEEDAQNTGIVGNVEYDSMLDELNSPDVTYSVRRLVRGLASPRESSRLGFAVALTELLSRITTLSCAQILALLLDTTRMSSNQSGQEVRDLLFARLFGLNAIIHSGLLLRTRPPLPRSASAPSTSESCAAVIDALLALARAKSWLAEAAYWAIGRVMDLLAAAAEEDVPWRDEAVRNLFEAVFGEDCSSESGTRKSGGIWTPEKIALGLRAQRLWPESEPERRRLWAPTLKHGNILHPANLATLAKILKESEVEDEGVAKIPGREWRPQVHHVWDELLDQLLPPDGSGRSPAGSFQEFFRIVVDESLLSGSASTERKYWGFVIFQRALPRVKPDDLPMLFTKNFMRTWINHLSRFDRYLYSFAKQIAKEIICVVQTDPTLGFAFILQLTGVHGNQQFDKLTRTKTVESILTKMNAAGIKSYVSHLMEHADGSPTSGQSDAPVINARRLWTIEQLAALIRNRAIPRGDDWVQAILDWFIVHGIFFVKKKSKKSSISTAHCVPSPLYPDRLQRQCRERLLGCLAELTQLSAVTKTTEKTQKVTGANPDGQLWVSRVIQTIRVLEQDSKHVELLSKLDQDDRGILERACKTVAWLRNVSGDLREQAEGIELLLQSCMLQFYVGDNPGGKDAASLESCVDSALRLFPTSSGKPDVLDSHGDCEVQQVHLEAIDVLVDIIIGYLEKGTAFLRAVGNRCFSLLSDVVRESTVNLILTQLECRGPSELLADSDEAEDECDNGYLESGRDDDESSAGVDDRESDEAKGEENNDNITENFQYVNAIAETGDEESERDLDDNQMMAMDDQLAIIFKYRAREKKSKEGAQREAMHFKNRIMDLLDIFVRKQPTSPYILQFLVPLLALTFSDEKQVSEKATGLLMSRIGKLKEVPSAVDVAIASSILNDLHIRARKVHSRDAIAIVSRCSLHVSRALLHVGADKTVQAAYATSLVDFTERKTSDLNGQFFCDLIKRYPHVAWGMRAALLAAPMNAANTYRQGQAYMLLETLLKNLLAHLELRKPENELDDVAVFMKELQCGLHRALSAACDTTLNSTSSIKEALKLVLVAARMTKRLAAQSRSFGDIWDPMIWTELYSRLIAHNRFMASAALVGMCKQIVQLMQLQRELPTTGAGERAERCGQTNGTMGRKRKASAYPGIGTTVKKNKRVTPLKRGGKNAK